MTTMYLLIFTALGGLVALFVSAGWSSYKDKKLPGTPTLFRWFITGILTSGLASYAWIFGAGGDPATLFETVGESLEVKQVVETLTSAVGSATANAAAAAIAAADEIKVGMPAF